MKSTSDMQSQSQTKTEGQRLLKVIKEKRGLSISAVAAALGVQWTTVDRWRKCEGGSTPRRDAMKRLQMLADGQEIVTITNAQRVGQSLISIHLEVDPLNLNEESRRKIRAVKAILTTLETLAEQK